MSKRLRMLLLLGLALGLLPAWGQSDAIRSEFNAALRDAQASELAGPIEVKLLDQAALQLPQDYTFVPVPAAARLLKAMGNAPDPHLVGVIFPGHQDNWMMAIQFQKSGYIRDDDARDWNVDELLKSVSESTERGDAERRQLGFPEIEVLGWAEKPRYDDSTHRLVWAVVARDKSGSPTTDQGVNYNTYALGRDGYFKLNLVTDLKDLPAQKAAADSILDSLQYVDGKKYSDFNPATDKAADFSVVALVAGIAANKLGLLALLGNAAIEYLKFIIMGAVLLLLILGWVIFRRFRSRGGDNDPVRDDFPPTIVSTVALDAPTIPQGRAYAPMQTAPPGPDLPSVTSPSVGVPVNPTTATTVAASATAASASDGIGSPAMRPGPVPDGTLAPAPIATPKSPAATPVPSPADATLSAPAHTPQLPPVAARPPPGLSAVPEVSAPATQAAGVQSVGSIPSPAQTPVHGTAESMRAPPAESGAVPSNAPERPPASPPGAGEKAPPGRNDPVPVPVRTVAPPLVEFEEVAVAPPVPMLPLGPAAPTFSTQEDVPEVSEPEMVFTVRPSPQSALLAPALTSEPMLVFGSTLSSRAAVAPSPPPAPLAPPAPTAAPAAAAPQPGAPQSAPLVAPGGTASSDDEGTPPGG